MGGRYELRRLVREVRRRRSEAGGRPFAYGDLVAALTGRLPPEQLGPNERAVFDALAAEPDDFDPVEARIYEGLEHLLPPNAADGAGGTNDR
jgi:hypothetical protein